MQTSCTFIIMANFLNFVINDSVHSYNTRSTSKTHIDLKEQIMEYFRFSMEEQ